jgi:hypothetical protein
VKQGSKRIRIGDPGAFACLCASRALQSDMFAGWKGALNPKRASRYRNGLSPQCASDVRGHEGDSVDRRRGLLLYVSCHTVAGDAQPTGFFSNTHDTSATAPDRYMRHAWSILSKWCHFHHYIEHMPCPKLTARCGASMTLCKGGCVDDARVP